MSKKNDSSDFEERLRKAFDPNSQDGRAAVQELFKNLVAELPALEKLLEECNEGRMGYEEGVYRFYYKSFKVYFVQVYTEKIVTKLQSLAPNLPLDEWFITIVSEGTGKEFKTE